jgi:hypothetical protein
MSYCAVIAGMGGPDAEMAESTRDPLRPLMDSQVGPH